MKKIGIVAHSAEGGALCFITACREGQKLLGAHMHPEIVVSAIPMGLTLPAWEADDFDGVAREIRRGVEVVARAGADFFVCPDNTAHIVLERIVDTLPIPGLHIAAVVCHEIKRARWGSAALLGTKWTMTGPVYEAALRRQGIRRMIPNDQQREQINAAIFDELCQAKFLPSTTDMFVRVIDDLGVAGADCVILGCTEIPLIISDENSPLPPLDSTRLLAKYAVELATDEEVRLPERGWIAIREHAPVERTPTDRSVLT